MKATSLVVATALTAFAQSSVIDSGVANTAKFGFYWETRLDPGVPNLELGVGRKTHSETIEFDGLRVDRIFVDRRAKTFFGYTARLLQDTSAVTYGVFVNSLKLDPDLVKKFDLRIDDLMEWKQLPFPGLQPQRLRPGDTVAFTLMKNPSTGQAITETIMVSEPSLKAPSFNPEPPRQFSAPPGEPKDFAIGDAELTLTSPRLYVNGTPDSYDSGMRNATGRTILVSLPKLGRFTLSLVPYPGFAKAGEVRGTSLRFSVGADRIEIQNAVRIAPSSVPLNIYVQHDANAQVTSPRIATAGAPTGR